MSQQELLIKAIHAPDGAGVAYMASGSIVSSIQGGPRSTHDIDLEWKSIKMQLKLAESFPPPEYHLDEESIWKAIEYRDMFNLIEMVNGDKVDFRILKDDDSTAAGL